MNQTVTVVLFLCSWCYTFSAFAYLTLGQHFNIVYLSIQLRELLTNLCGNVHFTHIYLITTTLCHVCWGNALGIR